MTGRLTDEQLRAEFANKNWHELATELRALRVAEREIIQARAQARAEGHAAGMEEAAKIAQRCAVGNRHEAAMQVAAAVRAGAKPK